MNTVAIGVFQADDLKSLNSNNLLDAAAWRRRVLRAFRTHKRTGARQFYDDNGFLTTVDDIKNLTIVISSPEDSIHLNRATLSRVSKILKDCDSQLTFEMFANIDALIAAGLFQRELFENQNKGVSMDTRPKPPSADEVDQLVRLLEPPPSEAADLAMVFNRLRFDFLKDEPVDPLLQQMKEQSERSMDQDNFNQFMVNLDSFDRGEKQLEPIRISLAPEKQKNSMQILVRNSTGAGGDGRAKSVLTVDEHLRFHVHETEIVELGIRGRLVLSNLAKGGRYSFDFGNAGWTNDNLLKKTKVVTAQSGTVQESPDHLWFEAGDVKAGQSLSLYEYTINPKLLTDETIPIYLAYNQVRNQLILQVKINPFFGPRIANLRVSVVCSAPLKESSMRSSHMGVPIDCTYLMTLERQSTVSEMVQIKMQLQEPGIAFMRVVAACVITRNIVDFEFKCRPEADNALTAIDSRLAIDYTLVL